MHWLEIISESILQNGGNRSKIDSGRAENNATVDFRSFFSLPESILGRFRWILSETIASSRLGSLWSLLFDLYAKRRTSVHILCANFALFSRDSRKYGDITAKSAVSRQLGWYTTLYIGGNVIGVTTNSIAHLPASRGAFLGKGEARTGSFRIFSVDLGQSVSVWVG